MRHLQKGWDKPETVRDYEIFIRSCPLYREMASSLADRCVGERQRVLVDLGAGTGINTVEILDRMHPGAQLWSVDPSELMLARARSQIKDPRVRWLVGDSGVLADMRSGRWVDAFLANASAWMDPDPDILFQRVADMLNPGGVFGCTLPAEYLGEIHYLVTPEARAFSSVLHSIRSAAISQQSRQNDDEVQGDLRGENFPTSFEDLRARLEVLGFGSVGAQRDDTIVTAEDRARWYSLPPVLGTWLPGANEAARAAAVRELFARTSVLPPVRMGWLTVWARKEG